MTERWQKRILENFRKSANNLGLKVRKDFQNEFLGGLWPRV